MVEDEVFECVHSMFQYVLGDTENINDGDVETLLEYEDKNGLVSDAYTVDGFSDELESQREQLLSHNDEFSHFLDIADHVLLGKNCKTALETQRKTISQDWDTTLTIPVL